MQGDRTPQVGDLLIVTSQFRKHDLGCITGTNIQKHSGIIYDIVLDKWGHQGNVFVQWTNGYPPSYNHQHGYSGTNIHNLRSEFQIIRKGESVT